MARPNVFAIPTTLYHPTEGARVFPAGETDPGLAWSDSSGGDRNEKSMGTMATDLIEANDRADAMGDKLAAQAHDMAQTAAEADAAKAGLADAEQKALAAQDAQAKAEDAAQGYMAERDEARGELATANERLEKSEADLSAAQTEAQKVPGLVEQVGAANQAAADAKTALDEANAKVASLTADLDAATAPKAKAKTPATDATAPGDA